MTDVAPSVAGNGKQHDVLFDSSPLALYLKSLSQENESVLQDGGSLGDGVGGMSWSDEVTEPAPSGYLSDDDGKPLADAVNRDGASHASSTLMLSLARRTAHLCQRAACMWCHTSVTDCQSWKSSSLAVLEEVHGYHHFTTEERDCGVDSVCTLCTPTGARFYTLYLGIVVLLTGTTCLFLSIWTGVGTALCTLSTVLLCRWAWKEMFFPRHRRCVVSSTRRLLSALRTYDRLVLDTIRRIQEVELVSRGFRLGVTLSPITRLERYSKSRKARVLRSHLLCSLTSVHAALRKSAFGFSSFPKASREGDVVVDVNALEQESDGIPSLHQLKSWRTAYGEARDQYLTSVVSVLDQRGAMLSSDADAMHRSVEILTDQRTGVVSRYVRSLRDAMDKNEYIGLATDTNRARLPQPRLNAMDALLRHTRNMEQQLQDTLGRVRLCEQSVVDLTGTDTPPSMQRVADVLCAYAAVASELKQSSEQWKSAGTAFARVAAQLRDDEEHPADAVTARGPPTSDELYQAGADKSGVIAIGSATETDGTERGSSVVWEGFTPKVKLPSRRRLRDEPAPTRPAQYDMLSELTLVLRSKGDPPPFTTKTLPRQPHCERNEEGRGKQEDEKEQDDGGGDHDDGRSRGDCSLPDSPFSVPVARELGCELGDDDDDGDDDGDDNNNDDDDDGDDNDDNYSRRANPAMAAKMQFANVLATKLQSLSSSARQGDVIESLVLE